MKTNIIILGAGAAGLMCAIALGKRGRSVIILDHLMLPVSLMEGDCLNVVGLPLFDLADSLKKFGIRVL